MRELRHGDIVHRVKGRPALERRAMALVLAVSRFARCRAATRTDQAWAATMSDGLQRTLEAVRHQEGVSNGQ